VSVHGSRSTTIDGDDLVEVAKDRTVRVDHALKIQQGPTTVEWQAGHVDLQAGSWIRIKHTSSEIYIDEEGKMYLATTNDIAMTGQKISISGQTVAIEATQELRLSAGTGSLKLDGEGASVGGNKVCSAAQVLNEITGMMVKVN